MKSVGMCAVLAVVAGCWVGCTEAHSPHICNGYDSAVSVEFSLRSGHSDKHTLPSGHSMSAGLRDGDVCVSLSVSTLDGRKLAEYTERDLAARRVAGRGGYEAWLLTTNGVFTVPVSRYRDWERHIHEIDKGTRRPRNSE
jgi:hypothetical protein